MPRFLKRGRTASGPSITTGTPPIETRDWRTDPTISEPRIATSDRAGSWGERSRTRSAARVKRPGPKARRRSLRWCRRARLVPRRSAGRDPGQGTAWSGPDGGDALAPPRRTSQSGQAPAAWIVAAGAASWRRRRSMGNPLLQACLSAGPLHITAYVPRRGRSNSPRAAFAMGDADGPSGRRQVAGQVVRHQVVGRQLPAHQDGVPPLGDAERRAGSRRPGRGAGRGRALPPLRLPRLPLGAPDADPAQAEEAEDVVSLSVVDWFMGAEGWTFSDRQGCIPDSVNGAERLYEVYLKADPTFTGRVTVPVLWDKKDGTIVNNESAEILRIFNSSFDAFGDASVDFCPPTFGPRSMRPTRRSTRRSTTASTSAASRRRRRPTRSPSTSCSTRSTGWRSACRASAISRATGSPRRTGACSRR